MSKGLETKAQLRLMAWLSPAFPIGGFAWSGGLERAVHDRLVCDAAALGEWLEVLLRHGPLWNDAVLFCAASRAVDDADALAELSELGLALVGSAERHAETLSLGKAFAAAAVAWPDPVFGRVPKDVPFPVAVGAVAAAHRIPAGQALAAYLHAVLSQSVSAAIRLGVCGQAEGVALVAALESLIAEVAEAAEVTTTDDLGTATLQAEIASLRHETQHSRLFRS